MSQEDDTVYYYAEGERAIGPFTLTKLRQMAAVGLIAADVLTAAEGSEEWKPLSAYADNDTVAPAPSPQSSETKSPAGAAAAMASLWKRHIARWPHAFMFSSAVLVLTMYLYNRLVADPGCLTGTCTCGMPD